MLRTIPATLTVILLAACGQPGRPLALELDGNPAKLSEANSSWDHGILSLDMLEDPIPSAADDETHYYLRVDISEPYELDDQTLALSGTAVIEGWDCGPTTIGFIREDESHPRVVRAAAWRTSLSCDAADTPFSQSVEGVLDIYEVTAEHITGSIDVTVEPLGGSESTTARFHGRFDSR